MPAPDVPTDEALGAVRGQSDPEDVEALLDPFERDGWTMGDDTCSECGSTETEAFDLEFEPMEDSDASFAPQPARVVCHGCETVLYEHPKWRVLQIFGEEYAYRRA